MELLVDGHSVFAATGGRPFRADAPLLLFLHGAGMDHTTWVLQARFFAHHGHAVLALDLPGHGRSEGPPLASIEAAADWLLSVIKAAGAGKAAVVGHSMGAAVALTAAGRSQSPIGKLALLGAATRYAVHPDLLAAARAGSDLAAGLMAFWGLGTQAQFGGHVAPGLWLTEATRRLIERGLGMGLAADLEACRDWQPGDAAAQIRCPTLVIAGSEDRMTPAKEGRAVASLIAGSEFQMLPGAGHMMMLEQPDQTVDVLQGFLAKDSGTQRTGA
ncbi:MAG: alpha/beta hydrolase [Proteobacteria bacterium]|nr:alpha/beta hydrolase [Pseudomonadota bacterium]MBI3497792.1 alpha/beta hydrolase [Pseudomonadota bacterium]